MFSLVVRKDFIVAHDGIVVAGRDRRLWFIPAPESKRKISISELKPLIDGGAVEAVAYPSEFQSLNRGDAKDWSLIAGPANLYGEKTMLFIHDNPVGCQEDLHQVGIELELDTNFMQVLECQA